MRPVRRVITSLGLLLAAGLFCSRTSAFPKIPAFDRHGDPLPPGAVARLGTVQLRAGCESLHFSPDGKTLLGVTGRQITVWDAADGRLVASRRLPGPDPTRVSRSEDGRTVAVATEAGIELWDVPDSKLVNTLRWSGRRQVGRLAVSDDRRWVVLADRLVEPQAVPGAPGPGVQRVSIWDTVRNTTRVLAEDEQHVQGLSFAPDGDRLASWSPSNGIRVWEAATGNCLWAVRDIHAGEAHFTPDGSHLIAAPGFGQNSWHAWDVGTGKASGMLRLPPNRHVDAFTVLPGGSRLLLSSGVWDLQAGEMRHRFPAAGYGVRAAIAPDGRSVVTHDVILRRWELATGRNLYPDVSRLGHTAPVSRLFFTPDGAHLVTVGIDDTVRLWDPSTTKLVRSIPWGTPTIDTWSLAPDGSALVGVDSRLRVYRWPLSGGPWVTVDLGAAQQLNAGLRARDARVLPNGTLALLARAGSSDPGLSRFRFSFWDPLSGRLDHWGGDPGPEARETAARLAPDGRSAVGADAAYDTATGARLGVPHSPFGIDGIPVFTPDGRLMAASSRGLRVWEVATGGALADLPVGHLEQAALSPDGRWVACAGPERLTVWDVLERMPVSDLRLPQPIHPYAQSVTSEVSFSPDSRTIATGHPDGTIHLWPVPARSAAGRWAAGDGSSLWQDLGDEIPVNAWSAVWQLADHPADAVRMLRGKYTLAPVAAADEFARLISGLDSPKFAEREAASKRLGELGRAAERSLRQALKAGPSPEQSKRIEALLAGLTPPARPRVEDLRAARAVAVLEACATADARRLLAEWAERGPPRLSDEAARAVERLKWKPVRP
ncbi:MAG TPA: WD40 repeat domain-containing protein [Gemmataceae bacterium]|nr:WD40 repeat domain-containing protein [Gemmataceae bacterium]